MEEILVFILFFYESIFIQLCCEEIGIMKTLFANMNLIRIYDVSFSVLLTLAFVTSWEKIHLENRKS